MNDEAMGRSHAAETTLAPATRKELGACVDIPMVKELGKNRAPKRRA